jgi:hypothetical protein
MRLGRHSRILPKYPQYLREARNAGDEAVRSLSNHSQTATLPSGGTRICEEPRKGSPRLNQWKQSNLTSPYRKKYDTKNVFYTISFPITLA